VTRDPTTSQWAALHTAQWDEWSAATAWPAAAPRVQIACALADAAVGTVPFVGGELPALQQRLLPLMQRWWAEADTPRSAVPARLLDPLRAALADSGLRRISWQWGARTGGHWLHSPEGHPGTGARTHTPAGAEGLLHWRRYRFQSAHRLPHVPPGHKCGRMHGHGFEAVVSARNTPPEQIDEAWAPLQLVLHHRCLNTLAGLDNPTSEHLARWLWRQLAEALPGLDGVSVFETASCGAHASDADGLLRIWKDFTLDSATRLHHAPENHPRAQLHGHTYQLRLHLRAPLDARLGWAVDFGEVKSAFKPVFDALDHHAVGPQHLSRADRAAGEDHPGDVAHLARWVAEQTRPLLPALYRVDLSESEGHGVVLAAEAHTDPLPLLPAAGA
jgi:6-pyruvoyl-tetrahydropterin synthase